MPAAIEVMPSMPVAKAPAVVPGRASKSDGAETGFEQALAEVKAKVKEESPGAPAQTETPKEQSEAAADSTGKTKVAGKKPGKASQGKREAVEGEEPVAEQASDEVSAQTQQAETAAEAIVANVLPEGEAGDRKLPGKPADAVKVGTDEAAMGASGAPAQAAVVMQPGIVAQAVDAPEEAKADTGRTAKNGGAQTRVPVKELSGPTAEEDADGAAEGAVSELTVGRVKGGMEQEPGKAAPAERKEGQPRPDLPAGQGAAVKEAAAVEIKRSGAGDEAQAKDGAAAGQAVEKPQVAAAPKRKPEGLLVDEGEVAAKELQNRQSGAEARQAAKRSEEAASPQAVEQAAAQPPEEKLSAARPEPVVKLDEAVARPVAGVANVPQAGVSPQAPAAKATALPALPPEAGFAEANHGRIVTGIRTELLPNGGTMQIRLDPPELGALQVRIEMRDGIVSASFQTSSDDATRLLSHSLHQLKQTLESQGVSVEKLQVEQAPRERQGGAGDGGQQAGGRDAASQQQEQQRREMLERMWRRLQRGGDPLDLLG